MLPPEKKQKKSLSFWITTCVVMVHILGAGCAFLISDLSIPKKKKILVRSKRPQPSIAQSSASPLPSIKNSSSSPSKPASIPPAIEKPKPAPPKPAPPKTPPTKVEKKPVVKNTKKEPPKKIPAKKEPPVSKSTPPPVAQETLKELQKNLENLSKWDTPSKPNPPSTKSPSSSFPSKIVLEDISITTDDMDFSDDYGSCLTNFLQESLNLPEYGEVTMSIRLKRDGTVLDIKVVHSYSSKNTSYLEKTLPKLRFPSLASFNIVDKEKTFQVTFCNKQE